MKERKLSIAIDGPAAAGKSTVAKMVADALSIVYIDTGAMYRALTLKALTHDVDLEDEQALIRLLQSTEIELSQGESGQIVLLDKTDVTADVRRQNVTNAVSHIATHELVREEMVRRQQQLANNISVIMDGRDIGTHVLPHADLKIFLLASVKERALRRHKENTEKGFASNLDSLMAEIEERDHRDQTRQVSPLVKADDAIEIDTTSLSIEDVVAEILKRIEQI